MENTNPLLSIQGSKQKYILEKERCRIEKEKKNHNSAYLTPTEWWGGTETKKKTIKIIFLKSQHNKWGFIELYLTI